METADARQDGLFASHALTPRKNAIAACQSGTKPDGVSSTLLPPDWALVSGECLLFRSFVCVSVRVCVRENRRD